MRRRMLGIVAAAVVVSAAGGARLDAQVRWTTTGDDERCDASWGGRDRDRHCEVREATLPSAGRLAVDGGMNGGIRVSGWDRDQVQVRARVWANARSPERAREIASLVELQATEGELRASGPDTGDREHWGVSWEVTVPRATDLRLETHNGGITVEGVEGVIAFDALNGGVRLEDVAGDVRGHTTNGSLHVSLAGSSWSGRGLDAETTNGAVTIEVPRDYSAELETGTVNGRIDLDFPVTVQGRIGRSLRTVLGDGGPRIRATTTNGAVRVVRR